MIATGNLKINQTFLVVVVILATLGIGAVWEIFEYASDTLIYPKVPGWHHFQGNAQQDANTDTMTDLVTDTVGGIFGALLCIAFVNRMQEENSKRLNILVQDMSPEFLTAHQIRKKSPKASKI
jgi:hypothetical protein